MISGRSRLGRDLALRPLLGLGLLALSPFLLSLFLGYRRTCVAQGYLLSTAGRFNSLSRSR
jgi:hypothetical protein